MFEPVWAPAAQAGTQETHMSTGPRPINVLFVGNSYTRFNVMPVVFRRLAESHPDAAPVNVKHVAHGGYTLRMHWRSKEPQRAIREGEFTHVVVQGHSMDPLERPGEFEHYLNRFHDLIESAGSKMVLYETWARRPGSSFYRRHRELQSAAHMQGLVRSAYSRMGARFDAQVAPVGEAWLDALSTLSSVRLHRPDGSHPTASGSYLTSCVIYGTLTGRSPEELTYAPWKVGKARARDLRALAADSLRRRGVID